MNRKNVFPKCALILAVACMLTNGRLIGEDKPASASAGGEVVKKSGAVLVSISGEVSAKDPKKRELTIRQHASGVTLKVDRELKAFEKVKIGDTIRADYYLIGGGEIRPPTEKEKEVPLTILETTTSSTEIPGKEVQVYKMVATVEGLDRSNSTMVIKGPLGRYVTVPVKDVTVLEKLKIGETIVISAADPLAVSLEIITPPKK